MVFYGFEDGFTAEQVGVYAKPELSVDQMEMIMEGFYEGFSIEEVKIYAKAMLSVEQMKEVLLGLQSGLKAEEVMIYADEKFHWREMREMRIALIRTKRKVLSRARKRKYQGVRDLAVQEFLSLRKKGREAVEERREENENDSTKND